MMKHNESFNYQIKLIFFKLSKFSLVFSLSLLLILQTGCTAKDEEAPVISNVSLNEETIIVEAIDNVEIDGFLIQKFSARPKLITAENENWQSENKLVTTEDGTYYVWVKDSSGNISEYDETINVSLHLAKRFNHLNWLTPAEGTKVVDGVTYNLAELKAEYGDLYRFAEPLTEEEIESRFEYIAKFYEIQRKKAIENNGDFTWYFTSGLKENDLLEDELYDFRQKIYKELDESSDKLLTKFNYYFGFSDMVGKYSYVRPDSFTSTIGLIGIGTDIINSTTLIEKELGVKYFISEYEKQTQLYIKFNLKFEYPIESWEWN